ncbi:hypothetical protein M9194_04360 [Vibrio sp. S4M6]|uniref:hypothetical protein n=1 Tax=Vibrio sinus TaxID=2946865 RepID=UPI00202A1760|nr:hypothetical protein [Vibrio sinus]MCL9780669.1 hypothetical protein [Vibrio sinus]
MSSQLSINASKRLDYLDIAQPKGTEKESSADFAISQVPLVSPKEATQLWDDPLKKAQDKQTERINELQDKAKQAGIILAKRTFFKEIFNVGIATLGFGLSIAASVLTGGAGLPLAAASGVAFVLAVSDAGCAYMDWQDRKHGGEGLKMGSDSISNVVYQTLSKMGLRDSRAQWWAKATSVISRVGLTIGTLYSGTVHPASLTGAVGSALATAKMVKLDLSSAGDKAFGFVLGNTQEAKERTEKKADQSKHNLDKLIANKLQADKMRLIEEKQKTQQSMEQFTRNFEELIRSGQVGEELKQLGDCTPL